METTKNKQTQIKEPVVDLSKVRVMLAGKDLSVWILQKLIK